MKKKFVALGCLVVSLAASAQTITPVWNGSEKKNYGAEERIYPHVDNFRAFPDQGTMFGIVTQRTAEGNLAIGNQVWQKVSQAELFSLGKNEISENDNSGISYYTDDSGERIASVALQLFKKSGNDVVRLVSADIAPQNSAKRSSQSQKIGSTDNPLASGGFYKIKVDKSGIFKITSQFLKDNGINPANINPKNFRIYGNGGVMLPEYNQDPRYSALQEDAIQVVGESDGVWNDGDYALFYAQGPDAYNLYDYNNGNGFKRLDSRIDQSNNFKNIYEDNSYYFINFDKGAGKRVQIEDSNLPDSLIGSYDEYQVQNLEKKNLMQVGRIWVDDTPFTTPKTVTFTAKNPLNNKNVKIRTQAIGYKAVSTSLKISVNNSQIGSFALTPNPPYTPPDFSPLRATSTLNNLSGNSLAITYTPDISGNPSALYYYDYAEIQYREDLAFNGSQMNFRDFSLESGTDTLYGFSVANAAGIEQIWDVTDVTKPTKKVNKSSNSSKFDFGYTTSSQDFNNEFVAFRADAAYSPSFVGRVENQNLSAFTGVDYLIISPPEFAAQAQRMASYYKNSKNYNVKIVSPQQIYNEFSSGSQDITAIRDFVTKLNSPAGSLKYVLILGDSSYDFKDRIAGNTNFVPSYQSEDSAGLVSSFVTDDYFVMTKPQTSGYIANNLPDVPVGRIPGASSEDTKNMVDKSLAYENSLPGQSTPFGIWRMKADFVVDDDLHGASQFSPGTPFHNYINDLLVQNFEAATADKPEYNIRKLYLDSFPAQSTSAGQRFPQVNQAISSDISNSLYMFYFGHGGVNGWAQERVLTSAEIQNFNNFNPAYSRFPLVSTITCEFTYWDNPVMNSAGEQTIKLKNGGAATMITSSRALGEDYGINFAPIFTKNIFKLVNDDFRPLGDAFLAAKKEFSPSIEHLRVNYLGDPAMKLSRPKRLLVIDQVVTPVPGQIRALDFVKIKGHINNANGSTNSTFNGKTEIYIFDKKIDKKTLNNDGNLLPILNYKEEGTAIVKASGTVTNGQFEVSFYVPKDINYTIGEGRILAYADNKVYDVFSNQRVQIGDINPNGIQDNEPPKVHLYMNNTNFANGGITNQNPMLLACITDDTGINSTGAGIGHDITVYLDGQIVNTTVVNDYFSPGEGNGCHFGSLQDYQKGFVTYPYRNLAPGKHQLTFRVWDINNNSTTQTLDFEVKDESNQNLVLNRPMNWPNPFTDKTYIQFEHNCDDVLDVNVQIYTITGKLVRTLSTPVIAEPFLQGYRTPRQSIEWDGKDDYGATVGKGTYIFKIFAKSQNQEKCKGGATAMEKMVLLK